LKGYQFRFTENPFFELFIKKGIHINCYYSNGQIIPSL
jgi:hypothetical protein